MAPRRQHNLPPQERRALLTTPTTFVAVAALAVLIISPPASAQVHPSWQQLELFRRQQTDLSRRQDGVNATDVCNQIFPGRYTEMCEPTTLSNTTCCIVPNQERPKCVSILGYGFCCAEDNSCFVDVPSACDSVNSTKCEPAGCCPDFTTCDPNWPQNKDWVRCHIQPALLPRIESSSTTSATSSTSDSSSTSPATETTTSNPSAATTSPPPNNNSNNSALSTPPLSQGAIAGIAIGAVIALLAGIGVGYLIFRQRAQQQNHQSGTSREIEAPVPPDAPFNEAFRRHQYAQGYKPELEAQAPVQELDGRTQRTEK